MSGLAEKRLPGNNTGVVTTQTLHNKRKRMYR
jgi:hypothetical protein